MPHKVVGLNGFAGMALVDRFEGFDNIERTVVVGELLAGLDVAHGKFDVVGSHHAVGIEAVVDEAVVIPAEHKTAGAVAIAIGQDAVAQCRPELLHFDGADFAVEGIPRPDDGSFGNKFSGKNSVAYFVADESKSGMWVDHQLFSFQRMRASPVCADEYTRNKRLL